MFALMTVQENMAEFTLYYASQKRLFLVILRACFQDLGL